MQKYQKRFKAKLEDGVKVKRLGKSEGVRQEQLSRQSEDSDHEFWRGMEDSHEPPVISPSHAHHIIKLLWDESTSLSTMSPDSYLFESTILLWCSNMERKTTFFEFLFGNPIDGEPAQKVTAQETLEEYGWYGYPWEITGGSRGEDDPFTAKTTWFHVNLHMTSLTGMTKWRKNYSGNCTVILQHLPGLCHA